MAITVHQKPAIYTPAYNRQIFVALSNQTAQTGFKYVVEITVNGGATYTEEYLPRVDGHLVFDAMQYAMDYITKDFNPTITTHGVANGYIADLSIKIREYYTGSFFADVTETYRVWDGVINESVFNDYNYLDYLSLTNNLKLLQPNVNLFQSIQQPDIINDVWIKFLRANCETIYLTHTNYLTSIDTTITLTLPLVDEVIYFNAGYNFWVTNNIPISDKDHVYIDFANPSNASILELNFDFKEICTKQTKYSLYYFDKTGNILFKTFEKASFETLTQKKTNVQLDRYKFNASTHTYSFNSYDRTQHNVANDINTKLTLNTDFIKESQYTALAELFTSPCVWLYSNGKYIPVSITDTNYQFGKHENDKLFNLEVRVDFDINDFRQRGL